MSDNFEYIRKHKNPLVKQNGLCLYDGKLMKMVFATPSATLKLSSSDIYVHPQDDNLIIHESDHYMEVVDRLNKTKVIRELRRLVQQMDDNMPLILPNDSFEKKWQKDARLILDKTLLGIYVNADNNSE